MATTRMLSEKRIPESTVSCVSSALLGSKQLGHFGLQHYRPRSEEEADGKSRKKKTGLG